MSDSPSSRTLSLLRTLGSTALRAGHEAVKRRMGEAEEVSQAALRLVRGLDQLKGAAMKFGQLLSVDGDFLPEGWREALGKLQSEATARPWKDVAPLLESSLKRPWSEVYASIEEQAVHAASIGQVHRGILHDGRTVAVKIRYPGLRENVHADLENLKRGFKMANFLPTGGNYDALFQQVERVFLQELDFEREASFYRLYREAFSATPDVVVPAVIEAGTRDGILTTEWLQGVPLSKWETQKNRTQDEKNVLGHRILHVMLSEIFLMRHIQSDPNPGNFLVLENGQLGLLDFGATEVIPEHTANAYRTLASEALNPNEKTILLGARRAGFLLPDDPPETNQSYIALHRLVFEPFRNESYNWKGCGLSRRCRDEALGFARLCRFRPPPPETVFLNRRILGNEMTMENLGPNVKARAMLTELLTRADSVWGPLSL